MSLVVFAVYELVHVAIISLTIFSYFSWLFLLCYSSRIPQIVSILSVWSVFASLAVFKSFICSFCLLQVKVTRTVRWPWETRSLRPGRSTTRWTPSGTLTVSSTSGMCTRTSCASPSLRRTRFHQTVSCALSVRRRVLCLHFFFLFREWQNIDIVTLLTSAIFLSMCYFGITFF